MKNVDVWIDQAVTDMANEKSQSHVVEQLRWALREDDRPKIPSFPKSSRPSASVMYDAADSLPDAFGWGARAWETVDAYDQELAAFFGELACGVSIHGQVAQGLARRARSDPDRLYAQQLAARLTGNDCPPAAELPDDIRRRLNELAAPN